MSTYRRRARRRNWQKRFKRWSFEIFNNPYVQLWGGLILMVHVSGFAMWLTERNPNDTSSNIIQDWAHGIWWAFVTIFTVGYGDYFPVTAMGRFFAVGVMIAGIAIISVLTATISSTFVEQRIRKGQGLEPVKLKNHIILCGWNHNVENIISALEAEQDFPSIVLVNSCDPSPIGEIIQRHSQAEISFVAGDFSNDAILDRANVRAAECVIIVADTNEGTANKADEKTIITTLTIKNMNPKIRVYAHILNPDSAQHLRRANADDVVISDKYSGFLLAMHVTHPGVPRVVDELLSNRFGNEIIRTEIPDEFVGKNFGQLSEFMKKEHNAILIGIARESKAMALDDLLSDDNSYLDRFIRQKLQESGKKFAEEERLAIDLNPDLDYTIEKNNVAIVISNKS